ncbi:MAG: alpha-hydroxy acid oxidase [Acidimicrobiales bacterium]|jgi:isopentenyl diphosphate isomerase/L-lactate dehydrogenase-like FMN-dependent dehydrogenase
MKLERIANVADARRVAKRTLPGVVFDYIDGAADDEITMHDNVAAFDDIVFRPRMGIDVREPDLATTVLGTSVSMPLLLAPTGLVRIMHPDGAAGAARAAAGRGTLSVLSTVAGSPIDEVAPVAPGTVWFQLYAGGGRPDADRLLARAEGAGVEVLVVTIDTPALGNRERDRHHGVTSPLRVDAHNAIHLGPQVLARPVWTYRMARDGVSTMRRSRAGGGPAAADEVDELQARGFSMLKMVASPFSWADIEYLRGRWPGKLAVKGLLTGSDARIAADLGSDAVIISNHGGRQLDGAPATFRVLPEVVDAVAGSAEVLLDGGVRRGTHVVKAVALGARAVFIGRPYLYGLAAGGQQGVEHILDLFRSEISRTMVLLGCPAVSELGPQWVSPAQR